MALGWSVGARVYRCLISTAITIAVFYARAGRWDLPWLWATAAVASLVTLPLTLDPDFAKERRWPGPGAVNSAARVTMATAAGPTRLIPVGW